MVYANIKRARRRVRERERESTSASFRRVCTADIHPCYAKTDSTCQDCNEIMTHAVALASNASGSHSLSAALCSRHARLPSSPPGGGKPGESGAQLLGEGSASNT